MYFPRPVGQLASDTLCRFTNSSLTQIQPDSHSCMHARSTRIDSGWLAAKFSARLPPAACVLKSDRSKAVSDSYKIYFSHSSQFCDHRYSVTAPPRNFRSLRSRIPAGRASHAWLSHAPRATTEANTLRCTTEVPVLVNYLSFYPPTIPWVPGNAVTANQVRFYIESECCRIHGYI